MKKAKLRIEGDCPEKESKQLHEKLEQYEKQFCTQEFMDQHFHNFIVKDDGEIVGGVNFWISYGASYVKDIWMRDDYRGQGIATELMKRVEGFSRKKGAAYVVLETMEYESPEFYRKIGYKQEHERKNIFKNYSQYSFIKKL